MSNAITPFLPPEDEWRRTVDLAARIAGTEFVPSALRGSPESVLAAMLVGRELGIGALEALRSIHVIEGKPTESAELLHALVLRSGHDLYVAESTAERCVVRYRRASWPADRAEGEVVWTFAEAETAGLTSKGVWKKYPRAMLRSRAISEACRGAFPDVVKGAGYVAEELGADESTMTAQAEASRTVEVVEVAAERVVDSSPEPEPATTHEDAAGEPEPVVEPEDTVEVRRALYGRAVSAYGRIKSVDVDRAATAWRSALSGLPGESAGEAIRNGELALVESRVDELERAADEIEGESDGGTEVEPEPDAPEGGDGEIVDAEIVDDEPEPETCDVCGTDGCTVDHEPPTPTPAAEPEPETAPVPDEPEGGGPSGPPEAAEYVCEEPEPEAAPADPELEAEPISAEEWSTTNVADAIRLLDGHPVRDMSLSAYPAERRVEIVAALEGALPKPRRTVTARLKPPHRKPDGSRIEAARAAAEAEGSSPSSSSGRHVFTQPERMDPREYAERVGLWRRYEAAYSGMLESNPALAGELDDAQVAHVGRDPGGALYADRKALERLIEVAETMLETQRKRETTRAAR